MRAMRDACSTSDTQFRIESNGIAGTIIAVFYWANADTNMTIYTFVGINFNYRSQFIVKRDNLFNHSQKLRGMNEIWLSPILIMT